MNFKIDKASLLKFITAFLISLAVGAVGLLTFVAVLANRSAPPPYVAQYISPDAADLVKDDAYADNADPRQPSGSGGSFITAPDKTSFLILCTDAGNLLTDVMLLGCLDTAKNTIDIISLPRDTYITISESDRAALKKLGSNVRDSGVMKLNELHSYARGDESYTVRHIEEMLNVKINYYAKVDLKAFRNIVDLIGGVDMEIRSRGFDYDDPTPGQDLHIHVPGGFQHLNGAMAEGVVRYRNDYALGDLGRIEIQKEFMRAFFAQALQKDVFLKNIPGFISTVIAYVKTNFGLLDIPKYISAAASLSGDSISFHTLPGEGEDINGGSYFIFDVDASRELVSGIFFGGASE